MPDVSDYHRVNAALLPVDSAPTTVLGRKTGLEAGSSGSTAVAVHENRPKAQEICGKLSNWQSHRQGQGT
jgi:hypothetical protein